MLGFVYVTNLCIKEISGMKDVNSYLSIDVHDAIYLVTNQNISILNY